jgi:hypothetical protein
MSVKFAMIPSMESRAVTKLCPKCGHHLRYHVRGVPTDAAGVILRTSAHERTCRKELGFDDAGKVVYCDCLVSDE